MLKRIFVIFACITIVFPVFAQSQNQENPTYYQNAQKMLNQSSAAAKKQYEKTYPKPTAPVISNPMQTAPSGAPPLPPAKKDNSAGHADNNSGSNYSYNYSNNTSAPAAKSAPAPDVAVNPGNKNNSPSQNIFLPPGADNSNKSAPNPYG